MLKFFNERILDNRLKRLNIEITNICNYNCLGCPTTFSDRKKGYMSLNLFKNIFKEVGNNLDIIFLWNYGEPLLHPEIKQLLAAIKNYKCKKIISTTGSLLNKFEDLSFMGYLDEIIISINGITQEVYSMHQKGGLLSEVVCGVKKLSLTLEGKQTNLVMQTVAHKGNLVQLDKLNKFAEDLGFHEVIIKSFNVMDGKKETFHSFVPVGTDFSRYKNKKNEIYNKKYSPESCLDWMVINWNGNVNPCCWDYNGKLVLGNVAENGVYNVWNSDKMLKHRENIRKKNYLGICIDCKLGKEIKRWRTKNGNKNML